MFNVPQYIDVEDKIAGPLTAKQLLWMIGMGVTLMVFWGIFERGAFIAITIPTALIFVAFAFYKPYNQSLISFAISAVMYLFSPKVYIWKRILEKPTTKKKVSPKKNKLEKKEKTPTLDDIASLSKVLDTRGAGGNEKIISLIQKNRNETNKK